MGELTDREVAAYRDKLLMRREELASAEEETAGWREPVELDQQSVGRLSRMDAMQQQEMAAAEARRRKSEIARVDAALKRVEDAEYGWCQTCGEAIAAKRLDIDPAAPHCIACAA